MDPYQLDFKQEDVSEDRVNPLLAPASPGVDPDPAPQPAAFLTNAAVDAGLPQAVRVVVLDPVKDVVQPQDDPAPAARVREVPVCRRELRLRERLSNIELLISLPRLQHRQLPGEAL